MCVCVWVWVWVWVRVRVWVWVCVCVCVCFFAVSSLKRRYAQETIRTKTPSQVLKLEI